MGDTATPIQRCKPVIRICTQATPVELGMQERRKAVRGARRVQGPDHPRQPSSTHFIYRSSQRQHQEPKVTVQEIHHIKNAKYRAIEKASNHLKPPRQGFKLVALCHKSFRHSLSQQHMTQPLFANSWIPIERCTSTDYGTVASPEIILLQHGLTT